MDALSNSEPKSKSVHNAQGDEPDHGSLWHRTSTQFTAKLVYLSVTFIAAVIAGASLTSSQWKARSPALLGGSNEVADVAEVVKLRRNTESAVANRSVIELGFSDNYAPTNRGTRPTNRPTRRRGPNNRPSNGRQTRRPTSRPTKIRAANTPSPPTPNPTPRPTSKPGCMTKGMYNSIYNNVQQIKNGIANNAERSHFLGGIVRLAAHDFMDYDRRSGDTQGANGCIDLFHKNNMGLSTIWCDSCPLTTLHRDKFSKISRADFWVAAASVVVEMTSVNRGLIMKDTFVWGRQDRISCGGSGDRLPRPSGCAAVEDTFLTRMGMSWGETVALLGAHTLGRGSKDFSGHQGSWSDNDYDAQIFDNTYYRQIYDHAWFPRNLGGAHPDFSRGNPFSANPQMMLNTDMCFVYDLTSRFPCCTRTDLWYPDGTNQCGPQFLPQCDKYVYDDPRRAATDAVDYYGSNNAAFYSAFKQAWAKATRLGQPHLQPLVDKC